MGVREREVGGANSITVANWNLVLPPTVDFVSPVSQAAIFEEMMEIWNIWCHQL